ncbi:MAG: hypothetical protein AAGB02_01285 [Pseudomonadota bacterium]
MNRGAGVAISGMNKRLETAVFFCAALLLWACGNDRPTKPLPEADQAIPASIERHRNANVAMAARNPFLADSVNPLPHGDPGQQDSSMIPGPMDITRRLESEEVAYQFLGPGSFGAYVSAEYADGGRVLWVNNVNGLYKLDYETYEVLAHLPSPASEKYTEEWATAITASLDRNNKTTGVRAAYDAVSPYRDLSGVYLVVGRNNWIYIADNDGSVSAFGDASPSDRRSGIERKAVTKIPDVAAGATVGMNMTYDGWIILPTEEGYLIALDEELKRAKTVRLQNADSEDTASQGVGYGWVRNGVAVDEAGGIYVASRNHMHKVVWRNETFSIDEKDGAWAAPYRNGGGGGTGATPSLMGFGNEDRFVVITDGDKLMNMTLFWRDGIPEDWTPLPGAPSPRIAGMAPVTMGALNLQEIQSEQTVVVAGHGALVVNNQPRNAPFFLPTKGRARGLLIGPLGSNPNFQPYGVQKFHWDAEDRALKRSWVNADVSSPNGVPWVSLGSGQVYFVGARDNQWTLEALDWWSGEETFYYIIGGQKFNSQFSGPFIDEKGRIAYGTMWGRARIQPSNTDISGIE